MKKIFAVILCMIMILPLAGCGSSKSEEQYAYTAGAGYYDEEYAVADTAAEYAMDNGGLAPAAYANSDMREAGAPTPNPDGSTGELRPEKIIYSGDATIETTAFDDGLTALKQLIEKYYGFIESSSIYGANLNSINNGKKSTRSAHFTIRVPSENFDTVMGSLSTIGNVPSNEVYTQNISSQYYDTQARLNSYKATETRLIELLEKAQNVQEVIEIEKELAEVRYSIESLESQIKGWDNKVSYSTVNINLKEVREYTQSKEPGFLEKLWDSVKNGIEMLGDFILGLVEYLPIIILLGAIVFAAVKLVFVIKSKKKAKKAATEDQSEKEK